MDRSLENIGVKSLENTQQEAPQHVFTIREQVIDLARILLSKQASIQGKYGTEADLLHFFFIQQRIGLQEKPFYVLKLRTMQKGAHDQYETIMNNGNSVDGAGQVRNDPRVGRIGQFLRTTRIDELPQIIQYATGKFTGENSMNFIGGFRPNPKDAWEMRNLRPKNRNRLLEHTAIMPVDITVPPNSTKLQRLKVWADYLKTASQVGKTQAKLLYAPKIAVGFLRHIVHGIKKELTTQSVQK